MDKKKIVLFGEALLRLSPPNNLRFSQAQSFDAVYGGSELNVAISLAHFGLQADFITRLPENGIADCFLQVMHQHNVATDNIKMGGDRMGIYYIEMGAGQRGGNVVYDRKFSSMTTIEKGMIDWENVLKDADWFHWSGITPGISFSAAEVCQEALGVAERLGVTVSTDFNYRGNLWKYGNTPKEIMEPLIGKSDIVVAGAYASDQYFGIQPEEGKEANISLAEQLQERFPRLKKIAITNRKVLSASHNQWSAELFTEGSHYRSKVYDITSIVDRIGTGDSFVAGLIYGLLELNDHQKTLEFATAASCLKHTVFGDANLVSVKEVESLISDQNVGHVIR